MAVLSFDEWRKQRRKEESAASGAPSFTPADYNDQEKMNGAGQLTFDQFREAKRQGIDPKDYMAQLGIGRQRQQDFGYVPQALSRVAKRQYKNAEDQRRYQALLEQQRQASVDKINEMSTPAYESMMRSMTDREDQLDAAYQALLRSAADREGMAQWDEELRRQSRRQPQAVPGESEAERQARLAAEREAATRANIGQARDEFYASSRDEQLRGYEQEMAASAAGTEPWKQYTEDEVRAYYDDDRRTGADYETMLSMGYTPEQLASYMWEEKGEGTAAQAEAQKRYDEAKAGHDRIIGEIEAEQQQAAAQEEARRIYQQAHAAGLSMDEWYEQKEAELAQLQEAYKPYETLGRMASLMGETGRKLNAENQVEAERLAAEIESIQRDLAAASGIRWYDFVNSEDYAKYSAQEPEYSAAGKFGKYQYMTEEEIGIYNTIYATKGKDAANAFMESLPLSEREYRAQSEEWVERANNASGWGKAAITAGTVLAQPFRTFESINALAEDVGAALTGREIDPYSRFRRSSQLTQDVRGAISEGIDSGVGRFFYNAGTSAADSTMNMIIGGAIASALPTASTTQLMQATNAIGSGLMSSEVASLAISEGKQKGYSDAGALALGLVRGGVEYASEALGGEWVIKNIKANPMNFFAYTALNMVPEGVEEVMSDAMNGAINLGVDALFGTEESGIPRLIQHFKDEGTPWQKEHPELATVLAIGGDELVSFLSGSLASAGSSGVQTMNMRAGINETATRLSTDNNAVLNLMQELNVDDPTAVYWLADLYDAENLADLRTKMGDMKQASALAEEIMKSVSDAKAESRSEAARQAFARMVGPTTTAAEAPVAPTATAAPESAETREAAFVKGEIGYEEMMTGKSAEEVAETRREVMDGVLERVAKRTGTEISAGDRAALASIYTAEKNGTRGETYAKAAIEAYEMGRTADNPNAAAARANSKFGARLSAEQFARAYNLGAESGNALVVDASTEEGRTTLESHLAFLGTNTETAANLYEEGQDVNKYAAGMRLATGFAASGGDVDELVQQAKSGEIESNALASLSDAQVKAAQEIGQQMQQERAGRLKKLTANRVAISQQAEAILEQEIPELGELNESIKGITDYITQAKDELGNLRAGMEAMRQADENAESTEEYKKAQAQAETLEQGIRDAENVRDTMRKARKEAKGKATRKQGSVSYESKDGEVGGLKYKAVDKSGFTNTQKAVARITEIIAKVTGLEIHIADFGNLVGGEYVRGAGGVLWLNINATFNGANISIASLSHELTHWLQEYAPEEYNELKQVVADEFNRNPAAFADIFKARSATETYLDADGVTDEMVANACQMMLADEDSVRRIMQEHQKLGEKMRAFLLRMIDRLKAAFSELDNAKNFPLFKEIKAAENAMDRMRDIWFRGFETANENLQAEYTVQRATGAKENAAQEGDAQKQAFKGYDKETGRGIYESNFPENYPASEKIKRVVDLVQNVFSKKPIELVVYHDDGTSEVIQAHFDPDFDKTGERRTDLGKLAYGNRKGNRKERRVTLNLADDYYRILQDARYLESDENFDEVSELNKDVEVWHYFVNQIYYMEQGKKEKTPYSVYIDVKKNPNGHFVYTFYAREDDNNGQPIPLHIAAAVDSSNAGTADGSPAITIPQPPAEIKSQNQTWDNAIEAGPTDFEINDDGTANIQFSRWTWEQSDYVKERANAARELSEKLGISKTKAMQYIDSVNSVARMIADQTVRLDYEDTGRSPFVSNAEYGGSFDFTTLCKKRRLLTGTFSAIQQALKNTALTANEILEIRKMMDDAGLEVSCGKCYVEGSRASMGLFTKEFLKLYEKYNPGKWVPNMAEMNTPDGIEWVRQNHPEVYEQYEYFWNHYGTLRPGDPNLFASQQKPKLYQMRSAYKGEILQHFKRDASIEEKNRNGGVRMQSFSDFEIVHLIDAMQVIMDMSRVGLAGQAYTKVPDFAWALGNTGMKINLSIDAWSVENGKLVFNEKEGMNFAEAMRLRNAYSKNVGTICCVYDDAMLLAALADPRIDFIIPFHRSQWKKSQYKGMGLPTTTKDYTYQQNEKWLDPSKHTHEYRGRQVKDRCTNYMPNEYWDFSKSGKENAEEYLRMCARDGKRPKFYKFLTNNGDGSYSLKADGSTDGYWKLLIDFKMYDNDGVGSPQLPVRPDFNMKEVNRMLTSYEGGHNRFPVAHAVVDEFVSKYKAARPNQTQFQRWDNNSFKTREEIDAEIDRVQDQIRDIQNAQWNANEAAKKDPRVQEAQQKMWAAEDEKGHAGSLRERVEYRRMLKQVKEELAAQVPEGDLIELAARIQELKAQREQFLKVTPITEKQYDKLAKHFGTTRNYDVAGFILKDGRMLDFSGKKQYGATYAGGREIYHNEVGDVLNLPTDTSPRINMVSNGNIRLVPEVNGINLSQKPTVQQRDAIRGFVDYNKGSIHVDIDNIAGRTIDSFGYYRGTSASKILADIDRYFDTGATPVPQTDLRAFYQRWDDTSDDTTAERAGREMAVARLQSENAILSETLEQVRKLSQKQGKTIEALQKKLQITKTPETRRSDARKLAKSLIQQHGSQIDTDSVAEKIKALGDYLLQTETDKISEDQLKGMARSIAQDILESATDTFGAEDDTFTEIAKSIRGRKLSIDESYLGELDDYDRFRKSLFGRLTLAKREANSAEIREGYSSVDQFYTDMQNEYGKGMFPDVANEGEQVKILAGFLDASQPLNLNPYEQYMGEVTEELANRIVMDAMSGVLRATPPTTMDKAKARTKALQERIQELKKEAKLADREAASLYNTIYDLSMALDKAESRYNTMRTEADYRTAQVRAEGRARAAEIKAAERERAAKQVKALKDYYTELREKANERRKENAGVTKYRKQVEQKAKKLSDMLLTNSDKLHVPEVLKAPLGEFLESIDLTSKRALAGGADTQADVKFGARLMKLQQMLENQQKYIDGDSSVKGDLGGYLDVSPEIMDYLRNMAELITESMNTGRTFTINQMNAEDLKVLSQFLSNLRTAINNMNNFMANARYESVREAANQDIDEMKKLGRARAIANSGVNEFMAWQNGTPYYVFKRLGNGARSIFDGFTRGWEKMAMNAKEIIDFSEKTFTAKEAKEWKSKIHDIELEDGSKIRMTTAQIMAFSRLLEREQALKHIEKGGIRIGDIQQKSGKINDVAHYHLNEKDIQNIVGLLTDRQLEVAKSLQKYMAEKGSEWGNEISMRRFGYNFYTEGDTYFPIATDSNDRPMADTDVQNNSMFRLLNLSASKSLNPKASNALVVNDIFDVFADHMSDMAKMNGMGLPILDAIKWFNYKERINRDDGTYDTRTLQGAMQQAFGDYAGRYFRTLMKDINGQSESGDRGMNLFGKLISNAKAAAVGGNLRVALLQVTSYLRAMTVLKPQYLAGAFTHRNAYKEAMKYSGTAVWKSLGFFETDINRSMREQIQQSGGIRDELIEKSMAGAELGDRLTWGRLWVACKLQAKAQNKSLEGEALNKATADIFREVIYSSQVMDSTLTRSEIMRSKGTFTKLSSAFMAEPTLSYNILMDAASEWNKDVRQNGRKGAWKRNAGKIGRAFTVYVSSAAFAAFMESLADAVRDDDEDDFWEKFMDAFWGEDGKWTTGNFAQDLTILGKLPGIKNYISKIQGYKNNDLSLTAFSNAIDAYAIWDETIKLAKGELDKATKVTYYGNMTTWGKIYKSLQALSQFTGLPGANMARDATAIWNNIIGESKPSWKVKTYRAKDEQKWLDTLEPAGISWKEYQNALSAMDTDENGKVKQDEAGPYIAAEVDAGRLTEEQAEALWSVTTSGSTSFQGWQENAAKKEAKAAEEQAFFEENVETTGLSREQYDQILSDANADGNSSVTQAELGAHLVSELENGTITEEQAQSMWKSQWNSANSTTFDKWREKNGTSTAPNAALLEAKPISARPQSTEPEPMSVPEENADELETFKRTAPVYSGKVEEAYHQWQTEVEPLGVDLDQYVDYLVQSDTDGNGSVKQDELGMVLWGAVNNRDLTMDQASAIWRTLWTSNRTFEWWLARR